MMKNRIARLLAPLAAFLGTAAAEPLEIWISSFQDKVYYENMVERYRNTQDDAFRANIRAFGFREMPDKLAVAIKTGANPPDIVQLDEVLFGVYLRDEPPFVDVSERVKEAGLDKDIAPQRLALFAHQGHQYGLPQSLSAMVLYYRTDLFEKHDLSPYDLETWDDFIRVGERLAKDNQPLIALDPTYFEVFLRQRGTDWFDADGNVFPDQATAVDTLRFMADLVQREIAVVPDRSSIFDPVFFSSSVSTDQVLCLIGADWYGLDMIQQFAPELAGKWGVMPLPAWREKDGRIGRRTSTFAGQGLLIYKGSPRIDAAWEFIRFVMTDPEANAQRFLAGNSFPAYQPAWKDERLLKNNAFFNNQPFGRLLVSLAPEVPTVIMDPRRPQAVFMFQESYFSSVVYGGVTPEQAVERMKETLEKD